MVAMTTPKPEAWRDELTPHAPGRVPLGCGQARIAALARAIHRNGPSG